MLLDRLLTLPGFIYQIGSRYYYLGKWICKECSDVNATDCVTMYQICRSDNEEPETNMYFQKLRVFSDFALEVPYDPSGIKANMSSLLSSLNDDENQKLEAQVLHFEEDLAKYCS